MTNFNVVRTFGITLAATALMAIASDQAQAQVAVHGPFGGGIHVGGGGISVHGPSSGYNSGHSNHLGGGHFNAGSPWGGNHWGNGFHRPIHGSHVPSHTWHDTSHWDYHPGQYVPHGNHFDYQPGHYDFHQQGHVDHNHF